MAESRGLVLDELRCRAREQDLASAGGGADACGPVDGEANVAVATECRLARVKADPHPHARSLRPLLHRQRLLHLRSRSDRCLGASEDRKEGIALTIDLDPPVLAEDRTEHTIMRGDELPVALAAKLLEQP